MTASCPNRRWSYRSRIPSRRDGPVSVYRVFANEQPVAALFVVSARDGFTGPIKLLVGVAASGALTGVRVLEHKETPGLGDLIESSRSDWILQFSGRSLGDPDVSRWAIRRDGGDFDQLDRRIDHTACHCQGDPGNIVIL